METFMEIFMEISSHKSGGKKATKKAFWGHFQLSEGYTYRRTYSKSILAVILKSQPTLYNRRFTRYGKSCSLVIIRPQNTKSCIFGELPEEYKYRRPPLENHFLRSF